MSDARGLGTVGDRRRSLLWRAGLPAALVLCVVALALFGPVPVSVDGSWRLVSRGTTPAQLAREGALKAPGGDLLSVNGDILQPGKGGAPVITLNGVVADASATVGIGAAIASTRGSDIKEDVKTETVSIEPSTIYVGVGSVESVASTGSPGTVRVTIGVVSKIEVKREVITEPSPKVILRGTVARGSKYVALTFDDGPWPGQTDKILDILRSNDAKATFFMLGMSAQRNPTLAKSVVKAGMEIATHSQSHKMLAKADAATVAYEIGAGATTVRRYTGVKPYWYRPAGGSVSPLVYARAQALGLKLILWSLDTHDYSKPGAQVIADRVIGNAKNGSVVLMHDGGGDRSQTIAALPIIIKALHARGFHLVTLTELYARPDPPKMPVKP